MIGHRISDAVHDGVDMRDIYFLEYPPDQQIHEVGVTGLFLGYFEPWDTERNRDLVLGLGWNRNPGGPVEGAYNDIENLDCKWIGGLHDYMKFIKFGYGRATDQLCIEIRAGRMTRSEAIGKLIASSEGQVPWKYVPDFLQFLGMSEAVFEATLDRFTNKMLFVCDEDGNLVKDTHGNLQRKFLPQSL